MKGARIPAERLLTILGILTDGAQRALRLRVEGRSTAKGPVPSWLKRATSFDLVGLQEGSTVLELEAEAVSKCSPERFAQGDLFSDVSPSQTGLSVFTESLSDAIAGRTDSDLFDGDLVETFTRFEGLLSEGVDAVEIVGEGHIYLREEELVSLRQLRRQTPPDQRVRLAGKLDSIRHSDRMFTLLMKSGHTVRGVAGEIPPDRLAAMFGKEAVVSGIVVFRPSGNVLRVEAEGIEPATGDTTIWSRLPAPTLASLDPRALRRSQGAKSGLNAVINRWPGKESAEEIRDGLAKLS